MANPTKPISLTEFAKEIVHLLEMGFSEGDVGGFRYKQAGIVIQGKPKK